MTVRRAIVRLTFDQLAGLMELPPDVVVGVGVDDPTDSLVVRLRGVGEPCPEGSEPVSLIWPVPLKNLDDFTRQVIDR